MFVNVVKVVEGVCEALGLDPSKVKEVDIKLNHEGIAVKVEHLPTRDQLAGLVRVFKATRWKEEGEVESAPSNV